MRMNRRIAWALAAFASAAAYGPLAWASDADLDKVREMLRLDTERALAAERARRGAGGEGAQPPKVARRPDKLVLSAVYGLRGALTVVVLVNGEPKVYRQGRDLPFGATSASSDYRLHRIEEGCIYLRKGAVQRSACFDPSASLPSPPGLAPPVPTPAQAPPPMLPMLALPPAVRP